MSRLAILFMLVGAACTGGAGPIDQGGTSSSGASSATGSSSGVGGSSGAGSSSGTTGGTISASEFSQACVENSDCVAVYEGNICNQCGCANASIAKTDVKDYSARRQNAGCPQTDVACANDCQDAVAICAGGTCSISTTSEAPGVPDGG
jgi:hypothetical protein